MTRDIPQSSPSSRELFVFQDPKPRKASDAENADVLCSSQESTNSSGSTSGGRRLRPSNAQAKGEPKVQKQTSRKVRVDVKDCCVQTEAHCCQVELKTRFGSESTTVEESEEQLPQEALDLLSDEPSETYYKDLAEARREALSETLEENQNLHELNEQLQSEKDRLCQDVLNLSDTNESLKTDFSTISRLNETLEEENRLLKEALGLDASVSTDD